MNTERIEKVLALAMVANPDLPIPLSLDNIDLDDITTTTGTVRNTRATMYTIDTGEIVRYVGNSDVVYDRIDIARYWQQSVVIEDPTATTVADLVAIMRTRYGLDVLDTEVLNGSSLLPDSGNVVIVIDDTVSPLYVGTVTVAFTKDAGLSQQDGVGYTFTTMVGATPIVAYTDTLVTLQGSLNGSPWVGLITTRNKATKQYEHRFPTAMTQTTNTVRVRGGVVQLMDNDGEYIPVTVLSQYRGSVDATGYCAGIKTLTTVGADVFHYRTDLRSADYLFDGCTNLTSIPEHLFSTCPQLKTAKAVFRNTGLNSIPVTVFESCSVLTTLESAFEQCTHLTTVPDGLLRSNTALVSLRRCFLGCWAVTTNFATATFLRGLTALTDVGYLFADCPAVDSLPVGLFKNQPLLTKADGVFQNCYGLTAIPSDLFTYNPKLNTVSYLFFGCPQITGISPVMFQYNPDLEYMEYTFAYTGILTTPEIMFNYTRRLISIDFVFMGCTGLKAIPNALLNPLLRLQSANGVWYACSGITSIPQYLLRQNVNLRSVVAMFAYTGITSVEVVLFQYNTKITDFSSVFEGTSLTTVPQSLFSFMVKATHANRVFYRCEQLSSLPNLLFNWNVALQSVDGCFAYCTALGISIHGLFNHLADPDNNPMTSLRGLFQGSPYVGGTFADFKSEYPNVDWMDAGTTQGCVAGATRLTDYVSIGDVYKTPDPDLV